MRALARVEGILAGVSSGGAVSAALRLSAQVCVCVFISRFVSAAALDLRLWRLCRRRRAATDLVERPTSRLRILTTKGCDHKAPTHAAVCAGAKRDNLRHRLRPR